MFNIIAWPFGLCIFLVILLGLVTSRFINWAIYTWAYFPRQLGPWSDPPANAGSSKRKAKSVPKSRTWLDHLPVIGWWRLRSEAAQHGNGYWIRPLLIELIFPIALAWYYRFQISGAGLPPGAAKLVLPIEPQLHAQFFGQWILLALMAIATFIDFDEQSIPDYVTLPGTIIGIVGAALAPLWLPLTPSPLGVSELDAYWPGAVPAWINGWQGLAAAWLILAVWGFALLERRVILRRGIGKAITYFFARMFRQRGLWITVVITTVALMGFVYACWSMQIARWPMVVSSLFGLAFAGGLTWAVRISATYGYGMEALGFGDVTLMAMIGCFIGWQPSLAVFFLAPFVAIVFVLVRWIVTREVATPYGPYLCGAVVLLLVGWQSLWLNRFATIFIMAEEIAQSLQKDGWQLAGAHIILLGLTACILMIGGMLWIWQLVKRILFSA